MRRYLKPVIINSAVFFGLVVVLAGCARELKQESDLSISIEEFKQDIQEVNKESLDKIRVAKENTNKSTSPEAVPLPEVVVPTPKTKKGRKEKGITATPEAAVDYWQPKAWPFGVGEKITWALRYGLVEAGEATMEVMEPKVISGEPVLQYTGRVKSTRLMELIYKVNDTMHTWTGLYDHLPRRQEINQLESGRWGKRVVVFNPKEQKAKFYSYTNFPDGRTEEIKREDAVTAGAQDVLGGLYFVRFLDPLEYTNFPIHDRWKNWANELTYVGKKRIKVPAGEYDTHHFKMLPRVSGQLEPRGDVEIWFWDHPSRLLVKFTAQVKVGSVVGELRAYQAGQPFSIPPPKFRTPKVINAK
jgi:hypothetical protein